MPQYWILKTEPSAYSYQALERDRHTTWDGVKNAVALKHIRGMRPEDRVLIYHTGKEKAIVGEAKVTSSPRPDPQANDPKLVVVDLEAVGPLDRPVPLSAIKADPVFRDLALVRQGRLSVVPAPAELWRKLKAMGRA